MKNDSVEFQMIYSEPLDSRGPLDLSDQDQLDNPIGEFIAKCVDEHSLAKNGGVDASWNEEIGTPPHIELSKAFLERSDARIARVAEKIRANPLFQGHPEELELAVSLAREMRDFIRKQFNAAA
jgi:hypothetical protein